MYKARRPPADKRLRYCGVSLSQAGCRRTWPPEQRTKGGMRVDKDDKRRASGGNEILKSRRKLGKKLWQAWNRYLKSQHRQETASGEGYTLKVYYIIGVGHEVAIKTASLYNWS